MKALLLTIYLAACIIIIPSCKKDAVDLPAAVNSVPSNEDLKLPAVFRVADILGDNMVVQRDKPISVFGAAPAGHTVTVKATWDSKTYSVKATSGNYWQIKLAAAPANANAQQIVIKDNNTQTITFSNILIGDVWVCSGQSNMEMPLDSIEPYPLYDGVLNYMQEIANANNPNIRLIHIDPDYRNNTIVNISTKEPWQVCNSTNAKAFSAVAYYFGKKLQTTLNVPIGLVVSCVGGSYCESWVSKNALQSDPTLNASYYGQHSSSQLYNGMIYPLQYVSIKGFIWYQGEANRFDNFSKYTLLTSTLVKDWRSTFKQGALPFYYVQMTPYDIYGSGVSSPEDNDYAYFREAQANVRTSVGNTGMAVTMDVGDVNRIHPKDKKPVGDRLALLALKGTYGLDSQSVGPQYLSFNTDAGNVVTVSFKAGTATGLCTKNNAPLAQYFFLAGPDHVFHQATAVINGEKLLITPPAGMPLPIQAVRYAFTDYPMPNLQNNSGLPAEPFRSDTYDDVIW